MLLASPAAYADNEPAPAAEPPSLSDAVGDGLSKIRPMLEQKPPDFVSATKLVDELVVGAEADSFDMEVLLNTRARILIQETGYASAIKPMEAALEISDRHHFMSLRDNLDTLNLLAQLYNQTADDPKKSHEEQIAAYEKAIGYMQRWFKLNTKPNEDISFYYAQLLYSEAAAKNQEHPDPALIKEARETVEKVLLMSVHPKPSTYAFLLATLNQEQDYTRASEMLELMLSRNPSNKSYWADLVMFYMILGQNSKDEAVIRKYNIRAINAIERAQALGYLRTTKDNFNLFTLYYNSNQFGAAADILHDGLMSGNVDPILANWQLLASSYEQINQEFKAIDALKEASKRFPKNGELDVKISQVYYGLGDNDKSFEYAKIAMEKGGLSKPLQTYEFIAYLAYELHNYDFAKVAIEKVMELMKGNIDHQMSVLKTAIEDAIKEANDKAAEKTPAATPTS